MTKLERNDFINKQKKEREFWDDIVKPRALPQEQVIFFGSVEQLKAWREAVESVITSNQKDKP